MLVFLEEVIRIQSKNTSSADLEFRTSFLETYSPKLQEVKFHDRSRQSPTGMAHIFDIGIFRHTRVSAQLSVLFRDDAFLITLPYRFQFLSLVQKIPAKLSLTIQVIPKLCLLSHIGRFIFFLCDLIEKL